MDRFDVAAGAAIVALLAGVVVVSLQAPTDERPVAPPGAPVHSDEAPQAADVARARALLDGGGLSQATAAAEELVRRFPRDGGVRLLLGDVHLQRQDLPGALAHYRQAVELEPDLLDRHTPKFQGRKLRHVVEEALEGLEGGNAVAAPDARADALRNARYLLRRIAGSCG